MSWKWWVGEQDPHYSRVPTGAIDSSGPVYWLCPNIIDHLIKCGYCSNVLNKTYKIRYEARKRKIWEAAALLKGVELAEWIREALDEKADSDLDNA